MRIPHILPFLAVALQAAPSVETTLLNPQDSVQIPLAVRIQEIQDRRILHTRDPHLLGTIGKGLFEDRTALRTTKPVAQEIEQLVQSWTRPKATDLPVRLEILSFEGWTSPSQGPDVAYSRIQFRVVSLDSTRPGIVVTPQARSERKGIQTGATISTQLRQGLRDALLAIPTTPQPIPDTTVSIPPAPERWVWPDSLPSKPATSSEIRQPVLGQITLSPDMVHLHLRYGQTLYGSDTPWQSEYWAGFQWRGPWTDKRYTNVWSGELLAGLTWTRRLDAGASPLLITLGAGGLLGYERYRIVSDSSIGRSHNWTYIGLDGRAGLRYQPQYGRTWIWGGGLSATLRVPSRIEWLAPGIYLESGYNF